MVNISLTLYTKGFFGSFLKSPTQMGSLSINNSITNISRLGTFKGRCLAGRGYKEMSSMVADQYSALVYMSPTVGGGGGCGFIHSCAHGAEINFGDLTPYLTYDAQLLVTFLSGPRAAILTLKCPQKTLMAVKIVFE